MYSTTWIAAAVRSVLYASALSAGVLLCASSAHADDRDQLKSIQADIAARQRAIKQQQQQRASLLAQLKAQEEAIAAAARKLRETQDSLNQLNKQIDEMNAALAKLERQRASQERNLAAQLDAAFRQGPHTGIQMVLSGEEGQRNQRMQVYFSYFNQARQETIAELKKTREEMAVQKSMLEEKQSQQQTLVYEQKAQQAKLEQARNERKKTLSGLESSIQQGQQQLSELRANESRLRGRIAQAEAAALQGQQGHASYGDGGAQQAPGRGSPAVQGRLQQRHDNDSQIFQQGDRTGVHRFQGQHLAAHHQEKEEAHQGTPGYGTAI